MIQRAARLLHHVTRLDVPALPAEQVAELHEQLKAAVQTGLVRPIVRGPAAGDEREGGRRAILNYGHTIGHAIEAAANYETYRHGEAVILGMVAAGEIACRSGRWLEEDRERQDCLLRRLGIPPGIGDLPADRIVHYTKADKKRRDGNLRFILATGIGSVEIVDSISEDEVWAAIAHLQSAC